MVSADDMLAEIVDINDFKPHRSGYLECVHCGGIDAAVWPDSVPAENLECSHCGKFGMKEVHEPAEVLTWRPR